MDKPHPDYERIAQYSSDIYFRFLFGEGLTYLSPGFERVLGRTCEDALLRPEFMAEIIAPDCYEDFTALCTQIEKSGVAQTSAVLKLVPEGGKPIWVEVFAVPYEDPLGTVVGMDGLARDVSEHLMVADLLSRRSQEQATLLQAQRELLSKLDLQKTVELVVGKAKALLKAKAATLMLVEVDGVKLRTLASEGKAPGQILETDVEVGRGLIGRVVEMGVPQRVDGLRLTGGREGGQVDDPQNGSLLCAPLRIGDRVAGALTVHGEPNQFSDDDLDFLVALSQVASLAMANSQSYYAVKQQASVDGLTGAFNRRFFETSMSSELGRADRHGYSIGLLMVDVDDLKLINDRHGHIVGDEVLRTVVAVVRSRIRETDWVARYGGDEFAVVLPGCSAGQLDLIARKLAAAIKEAVVDIGDERKLPITVSIGGSVYPEAVSVTEDLVRTADNAERAAKRSGGDQVVIHMARPAGRRSKKDSAA